jgi:hypothetical protein
MHQGAEHLELVASDVQDHALEFQARLHVSVADDAAKLVDLACAPRGRALLSAYAESAFSLRPPASACRALEGAVTPGLPRREGAAILPNRGNGCQVTIASLGKAL